MLINELRESLKKYEAQELREIAVALYKLIPKAKKEESGIDDLLLNFKEEKAKPASQKKVEQVDFGELSTNVRRFLFHADSAHYLAPNKFIRKDRRSKWRSELKGYMKQLLSVGGENSEAAASLLVEIYDMLSYACHHYVFRSEAPIPALGYKQTELLRLVLGKLFYNGYTNEAIKTAVYLTLDSNTDPNTLHVSLNCVLVDMLKTPGVKETALEFCQSFPKEYHDIQSSKQMFKPYTGGSSGSYRFKAHSNYAAELYLLIKFSLQEHDDGIAYFLKNTRQNNNEIALYCLLDLIWDDELNHLWIREYEKALKRGIKPREELQEEYEERKKR